MKFMWGKDAILYHKQKWALLRLANGLLIWKRLVETLYLKRFSIISQKKKKMRNLYKITKYSSNSQTMNLYSVWNSNHRQIYLDCVNCVWTILIVLENLPQSILFFKISNDILDIHWYSRVSIYLREKVKASTRTGLGQGWGWVFIHEARDGNLSPILTLPYWHP